MLKKRSVNIKLITILVSLILPLFLTHVQQKTFAENVKKDTLVNKENLIKLNQKLVSEKNKEGLLQETIDFVLHLPVSGEMADSENGERSFEPTDVSFEVYEITDYVYQMAESGILDKTSVEDLINSQALELQELFRENLVETAAADLIGDELVARVALPIVDEDNRHHAYLFVESKASTQYTPNFVSLAQFEQAHAGDLPLEIHLYPKMIVVPDDVPKEPEQPTETPELPETDSPKIGLLPETGEVKAFVSLIGVAVVIGVTVIWRRRKSVQ